MSDRESNPTFEDLTLLDQLPVGVCLLEGPLHVCVTINPKFRGLFKIVGDVTGRPATEWMPDVRGLKLLRALDAAYRGEGPVHRPEHAVRVTTDRQQVRYHFLNLTFEATPGVGPRAGGVLVTAVDATELVRARMSREQEEVRLDLALSAGNIGTWDINIDTGMRTWDSRAVKIFGFGDMKYATQEEIVARIHPEDQGYVRAAMRAAFDPRGNGRYDVVYRIRMPDGDERHIHANGQTIFAEKGDAFQPVNFAGTIRDVTEQVLARGEILRAKEQAEIANSAKTNFLANMSHEIRTPLGSIIGFAELLREDDLPRAQVVDFLDRIDRNSHHLLRVIEDVLDLSKVEAGKLGAESIAFSLDDLLVDIEAQMGAKASAKGIGFVLERASDVPRVIVSDPTRVRQILINVIGNAIKFTARGQVSVRAYRDGRRLCFRVVDTGIGITAEQAARLFRPFEQADVSTTRRYGGTGLGLILTRRIAEALGGTFDLVDSRDGAGSTFLATIAFEDAPGAFLESPPP